ncbi:MAG: hypothetical protein KAI55_03900 [Candidatus Aenigmarchaeota archaeon]|nr:hypothetical protein [Candidatus Aenigmarchaeota archaeon]
MRVLLIVPYWFRIYILQGRVYLSYAKKSDINMNEKEFEQMLRKAFIIYSDNYGTFKT